VWGYRGGVLATKAFSLWGAIQSGGISTSERLSLTLLGGLRQAMGFMSGAKDKNINVPGASLWQYLQTEFGTKLALAMLL